MLDTVDRIERERAYHNARLVDETRDAQGKFYAAIKHGAEKFGEILAHLAKNADVLEYGCGAATHSFHLVKSARSIAGIDISDVAIEQANHRAQKEAGGKNLSFEVMNCEEMTFADNSFDLAFGRGIIHHLDTRKSLASLARVLRPNGTALFWEPLGHNHLLNMYRSATPDARTPDEHPLLKSDFDIAKELFGKVTLRFYGLTTILSVPMRDTNVGDVILKITSNIDQALFAISPLKWQAWYCVMEMSEPRKPT